MTTIQTHSTPKNPKLSDSARSSWFRIEARTTTESDIYIYDEIGVYGITASAFVKELNQVKSERINLHLNTPGGDVFDGTAIYNALKSHPAHITVLIDGLAASAGSFIALAGNEVKMADNAYIMIHEAYAFLSGEANYLRTQADVLDKINDNIAGIYESKSGKPRDYWRSLMSEEKWFTAAEAMGEGLIDSIESSVGELTANFNRIKIFNRAPEAVRRRFGNHFNPPGAADAVPSANPKEHSAMAESTLHITPPAQPLAAGIKDEQQVQNQDILRALNQQAANNHYERGRIAGLQQGREQAVKQMREIMAACPDDYVTAVNAFLSGQSADAVKLAYEAVKRERETLEAKISGIEIELARQQAIASAGGTVGGLGIRASSDRDEFYVPMGTPPEVQAKMEWDANYNNCRSGCTEKSWLAFRTRQLSGQVRILKTA